MKFGDVVRWRPEHEFKGDPARFMIVAVFDGDALGTSMELATITCIAADDDPSGWKPGMTAPRATRRLEVIE